MIPLNTQTKITVLIKLGSTEITGLTASSIACTLVKGDGTSSVFNLTGNISEINSLTAPGLYLITLPASILNIAGPTSLSFYNTSPGTLNSFTYSNEVGISAQDFVTIKKYLINNEVIDQTNGLLNIMDDNGTDILMSYYLQDEQTMPSIYNIRRKIRKN